MGSISIYEANLGEPTFSAKYFLTADGSVWEEWCWGVDFNLKGFIYGYGCCPKR